MSLVCIRSGPYTKYRLWPNADECLL